MPHEAFVLGPEYRWICVNLPKSFLFFGIYSYFCILK